MLQSSETSRLLLLGYHRRSVGNVVVEEILYLFVTHRFLKNCSFGRSYSHRWGFSNRYTTSLSLRFSTRTPLLGSGSSCLGVVHLDGRYFAGCSFRDCKFCSRAIHCGCTVRCRAIQFPQERSFSVNRIVRRGGQLALQEGTGLGRRSR